MPVHELVLYNSFVSHIALSHFESDVGYVICMKYWTVIHLNGRAAHVCSISATSIVAVFTSRNCSERHSAIITVSGGNVKNTV